jgi:hypothetical protein
MRGRLRAHLERRPWIGALLFGGFAIAVCVALVRTELRLPPHGTQVEWLLLGMALPPLLVLLAWWLADRGRVGLGLAAAIAAPAVMIIGMALGLGWVARGDNFDPATVSPHWQAFGAGAAVDLALFCAGISALVLLGREPQLPGTGLHAVEVHHVLPDPYYPEEDFGPYYVALCECGWTGEPRDTREQAFGDAREHDPRVEPDVRRPVA